MRCTVPTYCSGVVLYAPTLSSRYSLRLVPMRIGTLFQRPAAIALRGFSGRKLPPIVQPLMRARFIAETRSPTHAARRHATTMASVVHPAACAKFSPVCSVVALDAAAAAPLERQELDPLSMIARW